jgi:two-component system, NtrC family, sensor kinase
MLVAHRQSIRLLQGVLVASAALPALLFAYASWESYSTARTTADRQIAQARDVLTEHGLKVFEAVERSIAEINEIVRGMNDAEIVANGERLHGRLKRLADASSQIKSLWIFDASGRALVNSIEYPIARQDFSDRDYFKAHVKEDIGTFVGEVLHPRPPYGGAPFFGVSQRRTSSNGSFNGVIQASLLPEYFEGFYAKIGRRPGSYFSLIRAQDGLLLARYPKLDRDVRLAPDGDLLKAMRANPAEGTLSLTSKIDGQERTVSYLKLPTVPLYVVAGVDGWAVRDEWLAQVGRYLMIGLPATAALMLAIGVALRRTRRLYEEATRRQAAEDALKQAQRLEALGQLTGGVAHDFNNMLMVIGGAASKLKPMAQTAKERRSLDMIEQAVHKGENLTRKLLSFSRRRTLTAHVIDAAAHIEGLRGVLEQSVGGDVALHIHVPRVLIPIKVDPSELEIALINLTLNARDAMPDGGDIVIDVQRVRPPHADLPGRTSGEFAVISVSDTGSGVPENIRDRIFEPFFTTKPLDKGTGLGLSQVYGFAKQSGGVVNVTSETDRGARFTIALPVTDERLEIVAPQKPAEITAHLSPARVLLVEDNADVATIAADYLGQCGCTVVRADNAETAVRTLNERDDIDLVFSDIAMPGMSGLELGRLIRDHYPEIPVVLATGYSDKASRAVEEGFLLLEKPYSLDALKRGLAAATERRDR